MSENILEPVKLNEYNEGYGQKSMPFAWEDLEKGFQKLYVPVYEAGGYGQIIQELERDLMKKISTKPEKMDELDLAKLYLVGKSHLAMGNEYSAIACFKIIYSQIGFRKYVLSHYQKYFDFAIEELENLAKSLGYDRVNSVSIQEFLSQTAQKKKGCFIATAVYGSPMAEEVRSLKRFRDEILLKSLLGRFFVSTYYLFSPPIAKITAGSEFLRWFLRNILINPLIKITRKKLEK